MRFLQNPCVVEKLKQVQEVRLATEEAPPPPTEGSHYLIIVWSFGDCSLQELKRPQPAYSWQDM